LAGSLEIEEMGLIADALERLDERRRGVALPLHRDAAGREVDAGIVDAFQLAQLALDRLDAGRAVNVGHGKIGLAQALADVAAGEENLVARRPGASRSVDFERELGPWRAAAHFISPFPTTMRRTSR